MSNPRAILPRHSSLPELARSEEPAASGWSSQPIYRGKVATACRACQSKRRKCNGARPSCLACIQRSLECEYDAAPGQSRTQARKRKLNELGSDNAAMFEILWYLQTKSPDRATELLRQLRTVRGGDIGAMLNYVTEAQGSSSQLQSEDHTSHVSVEHSSTRENERRALASEVVLKHPQAPYTHGPDTKESVTISTPKDKYAATIKGIGAAIEHFFHCVGSLFYVFDKRDVDEIIKNFGASENMPLGDLTHDGESLETKAHATELAGMAAIGVLHLRLSDPHNAPSVELADYFYAIAKHGLDNVIEYNPLRAMKVCALLALYNIAMHATVALAYIELGLSMARNHGLDSSRHVEDISPTALTDHKRTHRTIVHIQCWLSSSLDQFPASLASSIQTIFDESGTHPQDIIQGECAKVTVIKAMILHHLRDAETVTDTVVEELRAKLKTFHEQLPKWMGLGQLIAPQSNNMKSNLRPIIFYVHLFYLSAMMLLSRWLIIAHIVPESAGRIMISQQSRQAIEEGYLAAKTNARVLDLMMCEGNVVQICWLCIFTAYSAGIMTAYGAIQKALSGLSTLDLADDIELVSKCLRTLAYCAQRDHLAGRFRDILSNYVTVLQNQYSHTSDRNEESEGESPAEMLFTIHSGPTNAHAAARDLLRLIHRPFSGFEAPLVQATVSNTMEAALGTHLEWQWELKTLMGQTAGIQGAISAEKQEEGRAWTIWTSPATLEG